MPAKNPEDFKKLSEELDAILADLQKSDIQVDDAVNLYKRGNEIVNRLESYLKLAENKLTKLRANSLDEQSAE